MEGVRVAEGRAVVDVEGAAGSTFHVADDSPDRPLGSVARTVTVCAPADRVPGWKAPLHGVHAVAASSRHAVDRPPGASSGSVAAMLRVGEADVHDGTVVFGSGAEDCGSHQAMLVLLGRSRIFLGVAVEKSHSDPVDDEDQAWDPMATRVPVGSQENSLP